MSHRSVAATIAALILFAVAALPARSAEFTDAAGRRVVLPARIGRVLPAGEAAAVLVYVLAPEKLAGWSRPMSKTYVPPRFARLPVVGALAGANPNLAIDAIRRVRPDLVLDVARATPERAAFADLVQRQTGIAYIIADDSFARMPRTLRSAGALLGVADRAKELSRYAENAIAALRGLLLIRPSDRRPRIYYGRGFDGLETALPGSAAGETIDEMGAINVAAPLGRDTEAVVMREQLLGWDPDVILAEKASFYDALHRSRSWRGLSAVRNKHVYLAPANPFGWIDGPPGINRLVGLYWLSNLFYRDTVEEDLRTVVRDFYDRFYRVKLTDAQLEALLRRAGAPPPEPVLPGEAPIAGLGGAPPLALPPEIATPTTPGAAPAPAPGIGPPGRRGLPGLPMPGSPAR